MHILIFCEQHPLTLGGAQVSTILQGRFLERAGHTVTFVSPAQRSGPVTDPRFIDLPSHRIPGVAEYTWLWPATQHLDVIERRLSEMPPVDLVHVQSDFWGAALGFRFAEKHGLPSVYSLHNRLDVGIDRSVPFPNILYAILGRWQQWSLGRSRGGTPRDAFEYLRGFAQRADAVIAPSAHFRRLLNEKNVHPRNGGAIDVIPTGVDDDLIDEMASLPPKVSDEPRIVWVGRFSPEKRLLEFLEGVALMREQATVVVVGDGRLATEGERAAADSVVFSGPLPYRDALAEIVKSDILVQSSYGFETQGMTVTEAIALGTFVVLVDPAIAEGLPEGHYAVTEDTSASALAATLDEAVRQHGGSSRSVSRRARNELRQSSRTAQMIDVYHRVTSR